ncbi:Imm26 family immunity protein [Flavobacterium sp. UW10123]|uniref:Imm26 family immunity protein n=1 Tax=Flavobacterium sp. UW10123 TaxID=3230800 RepID=UPI003395E45C
MKKEVNVGDIFLIPFENRFAVCKVLWISKRTKNAFSFIVKDELISLSKDGLSIALKNSNIKLKLFTGIVEVFYTSIEKLSKQAWQIIGNIKLEKEEDNFLYHNIGGKLFKGDEEIRPLNNEELMSTPKMFIAGYDAIDNFLKMAFNNNN